MLMNYVDTNNWHQGELRMFSQLKSVVDLIRSGITDFRNFNTEKAREEAVLGMLRVYFLLKDCVDDGESLVSEGQPNPVEKISEMEPQLALATIERWDGVIRKQGIRLYQLQGALLGQDHITVISPKLQEQLVEAVGSKMHRAITLHGIGAALYFKSTFPIADTHAEKAHYISVMVGEEEDALNMTRISAEIESLRESLGHYREIVERMVSNAELLQLSKRARKETQFANDR